MRQLYSHALMLILLFSAFPAFSAENTAVSSVIKSMEGKLQAFDRLADKQVTQTILRVHGSNTVGEAVLPELAKAYLTQKGATNVRVKRSNISNEKAILGDLSDQGKIVQINIAAHGSSTGFEGLLSGNADIWASSRPVKKSEIEKASAFANLSSANSEHIVGIDGLAIIVHPNNPIAQLSKAQLAGIFSGNVKNWSDVGGRKGVISVYARDNQSGTWDSFSKMVLSNNEALSAAAQRFESSAELAKSVSIDPNAIGFIGMAFVGSAKLVAIKDGDSQAFKPNQLSVATEDYALSRRLFLYSDDTPKNTYVMEFLTFANGITGQNIVSNSGFISQNPVALSSTLGEDLPADYLALVKGSKRLSVNFRFKEGSSKLDNKANRDIQRLVYLIKKKKMEKRLILIGFGDRRKNESRSKLLSKLRAMAVRRELAKYEIYPAETEGYGDFNSVASNDGDSRAKNSRVEIWVR